jgi:hypothetical protein
MDALLENLCRDQGEGESFLREEGRGMAALLENLCRDEDEGESFMETIITEN